VSEQTMPSPDPRVQRIVALFEGLAPSDLPRLPEIYTPDARFKDPFNDVQGVAAITGIFEHMFKSLESPRFVIRDVVVQEDQCFLSWDFVFRMKRFRRDEQRIHGGSHLRFAADGRIDVHRDYWDAAEELYEKLPVLGALMRWLKRRAAS
jgi:steroid Delta-isomerase